MKTIFSSTLSLALSLSLMVPVPVLAQEEKAPVPAEPASPASFEEAMPQPEPTPTPEPVTETSIQETIEGEALEETASPQESSTLEEAIEVIDAATEERLEEEILVEATSTDEVIEVEPAEEEEVIEVLEPEVEEVAELPVEILEPTKEYTFEINGSSIATEETPEWSKNVTDDLAEAGEQESEEKVTQAPALSLENASKELRVAGACSDPYFVVLIYKDSEGYNTNPSSYIYNRAYPCENGQYSYEVKELPFSLESGTFYLLVAGQGDKGPWKPISAMIPIGITVKTVMTPVATTTEPEDDPTE